MFTLNDTHAEAMLAALREQAYSTIENQPEYLFEGPGGRIDVPADIISARLIGFDEEIVDDRLITRVLDDIRLPIPRRPRLSFDNLNPLNMNVATYKLQSNYATTGVAGVTAPSEWLRFVKPPDFMVRLLFLRYRRVT